MSIGCFTVNYISTSNKSINVFCLHLGLNSDRYGYFSMYMPLYIILKITKGLAKTKSTLTQRKIDVINHEHMNILKQCVTSTPQNMLPTFDVTLSM